MLTFRDRPFGRGPITCEVVEEAISARIDGQPGPLSRRRVRRHLVACPGCRAFERSVAQLRLSVSTVLQGSLSPLRPAPSGLLELAARERARDGRSGTLTGGPGSALLRPLGAHRIRRWFAASVPAGVLFATVVAGPIHTHLYPTAPTLCRVQPQAPGPR